MSEIASQTLELVGREINHTLGEARAAIDQLAELSAGLRRAAAGFRLPGGAHPGATGAYKRPDGIAATGRPAATPVTAAGGH